MLRRSMITLGSIVMMRTLIGAFKDRARFGQGFLRLVQRELGHVQTIIINDNQTVGNHVDFSSWMTFELRKRDKAWVPPSSTCDSFRTTSSPFQYFSRGIMTNVVAKEDCLRCSSFDARGGLEDKYGVF